MSSDPSNETPASPASEPIQAPSALNARNLILIAVSVVLCVACDQVTKRMATEHLQGAPSHSYWGDFFRLTYVENRGAFLGLGNDWPDPVRWLVFNAGAFIIVGASVLWILGALRREPKLSISVWALMLIGSGGIGNLIDRLAREGAVIDFMNMGIGSIRTGIFNVADVHIMVGLGLLLLPRRDSGAEPVAANTPVVDEQSAEMPSSSKSSS